jgi:two-component system nitrate/nitrite response regulator NarL
MDTTTAKTVTVCDAEPIVIEGVRSILSSQSYLMLIGSETCLSSGLDMVRHLKPSIVIVDKAFGLQALLDWIPKSSISSQATAVVVWGASMQGAEAVRFMQAGARGVIRKVADLDSTIECLTAVAEGKTWLEQSLLRDSDRLPRRGRSNLTVREQEVLDLVEQGMKNKDIAGQLGIRPGTVKIHLKHIFEKTGIHGRYGLALKGLKEKGVIAAAPM